MSPDLRRKIGCALPAGLALSAIAALWVCGDLILDLLPRGVARYEQRIGRQLRGAKVLAYWSLDEVRPREQVGGGSVVTGGTRLVSGRQGRARDFVPGEHGFLRTAFPLSSLGGSFSVSCWLRLPEETPNQQIFQYLAVRDRKLVLQLPGQKPLSWPIAIRGRFFHVAFTVAPAAGRVSLYIEGDQVDATRLRPLKHRDDPLCFGQDNRTPPSAFALDEVSLWEHSLAPQEIRRLSRLRWSLAAESSFSSVVMLGAARTLRDAYRAALLAGDLFNPWLREGRVYSSGLDPYALALSRGDVRYFNGYHNDQSENGLNAQGTSKKRIVEFQEGDRRGTAAMELITGEQAGPEGSAKRTFTLEMLPDGGTPWRKILFRPTEGNPYLLEVLAGKLARDCGLPVSPPGLCPVNINGTFEGIYLCSDVVREPGPRRPWAPDRWPAILRRLPLFREEALGEFDTMTASWEGALRSDRKSPLSSREILHDLRRQRRLLEQTLSDGTARSDEALVARVAEHLREELFLGDNPHADLLVGDLDLSARTINGAALSFASRTPSALDSDGHVTQPEVAAVPAVLRVTVRSGSATREKDLAFSVLPFRRRVPILRVDAAGDPVRESTTPFLAELIDGDGRRSDPLEGRIRLRGNTSLRRGSNAKKYYRLSLSRPHDVAGVARTDLLFLISGWRDAALMRERLSFDLFRSFSEPGKARHSPHVHSVELVVNGDYKGLYNLSDRVDAALLGFGKKQGSGGRGPVLYKAMGEQANFRTPAREAYVQKVPDWRDGEHWEPFDELIGFIGRSTPEEFRERIGKVVDVDNVIDFEILLLLTCNLEGRNYNLYLARDGGPESRFFIVPWDYDMTFHSDSVSTNFLIERLHRDLPGYGRRAHERWLALRRDRLSEKSLMGRVGALEAELSEAIGRNYRRWPLDPGATWEGEVEKLRAYIRARLTLLDAHFKAAGGP
jgi:hypothetical protein